MRYKFWFIRIGFLLIFFGMLAHMYRVQVLKESYYSQQAQAQEKASQSTDLSRGVLFFTDKHGTAIPAVVNKEYPIVFGVPEEIENPVSVADSIASIFKLSTEALKKSFSKKGDLYELIAEKATHEQVSRIRELGIKGIHTRNETFRFYPSKSLGAHVLGYIASAPSGGIEGKYGVELLFDDELKESKDIFLTIDRNVQAESEVAIGQLMQEWGAESATIIVQEPATGKIRALGHVPTFNPNTYSEYPISSFLDPAVESVYEPGSVFKIVTMAAGLDSGKITPDTTYTDTGSVVLNGRKIQNWDLKSHGVQTMRQVIEKSLNTGTIFAERKTGHDVFTEYVKNFGFGKKTGIQLPGEVSGSLKNLEKGRDVNYATASFGQGISVTPIQMMSAVSAIANGGLLIKPRIREDQEQEIVRRVLRPEIAKAMSDILVGVVDLNFVAHIPQYKVAGKTGTAFIPDFVHGGYTENVINTYVGFAPASDPKFAILIKLVKPKNAPLAGQTVVPVFKKLTEYLLNYYQVAPDRVLPQ